MRLNGFETLRKHPSYSVWRGMWDRCLNSNIPNYRYYGGRGISVCPAWRSFVQFVFDVGERPSTAHSIERIDNNGNYEPSNVRWATDKEQANNRRNSRYVTLNGERVTVSQFAERCGLSRYTVATRMNLGWPEANLGKPRDTKKRNGNAKCV